jgi:hypothetical protein
MKLIFGVTFVCLFAGFEMLSPCFAQDLAQKAELQYDHQDYKDAIDS